jgi:release factor glutamine methyltransferase
MYQPSEDSHFFVDFLNNYFKKEKTSKDIKILDMGSGCGVLAETCAEFMPKKKILCVDKQYSCVKFTREKGFATIHSNLFKEVPRDMKYDLILFNAPYLPKNKLEDKQSQIETTGGKRGDEISLKFLRQAKKYLKQGGKVFLLISSLTPMDKINNFNPKIVAEKKIWFEELKILEITFS